MKRTRVQIFFIFIVLAVASLTFSGTAAATGWTWDGATPDGWTWDGADAVTPDGWTWDAVDTAGD